MLMQEPTEEMIKEWKEIYESNKDKLKPNKKEALEIIKYLQEKHIASEISNQKFKQIVCDNILLNEHYREKLNGESPKVRLFQVEDENLYKIQDEVFKGCKIIVGIEMKTSFVFVEGSSYLFDELTALAGLDEYDMKNFFLVAQYIKYKEKFEKEKMI